MIEAGNAGAFVDAVKRAVSMNTEETRTFAHNAYAKGYNKYAAAAVADKFLNVITSIKK